MADSDPSDRQRDLQQGPSRSTATTIPTLAIGLRRVISSPRFRRATVHVWCVLKVVFYVGIVFVFLTIFRVVVHNQTMLVNLQDTTLDLNNKIEILRNFFKTQQQALLSLLSKSESRDKNTRELVESIKAVAAQQRQTVTDGALEKKVGKAVIGLGQFIAPWPVNIITSSYDLLARLATRGKK